MVTTKTGRCDVLFCSEPASWRIAWPSEAGGECSALRCDGHLAATKGTARVEPLRPEPEEAK